MSGIPLAVLAVGASTPLGEVAPTCAAIRAGVSRLGTEPTHLGLPPDDWTDPEPLLHGSVATLGSLRGAERLVRLAVPAALECIVASGMRRADLARTAMVVALPDATALPGGEAFAATLAKRLGLGGLVKAVAGGHCAAFLALAEAATLLSGDGIDRVLVVCVDSLSEPGRLTALDRAGAVRSDRSPDGYIPGEGAVALLVALKAKVTGMPRAVVVTGAIAQETVNDGVRMPSGAGLAEALRSAAALPHAEAARAWVLCDLNGSTRRHYDWSVALTRLAWPNHRLTHPADCLGDVGAASGGVHIALACEAFARGWAPADAAVAWTAADDGTRLAAIISKGSLWA